MKKLLAAFFVLASISAAHAQSTKVTIDAEIDTNWPDNTSGLITPALLRSTVKDIVASYVDWLVCTAQGGVVYWNVSAAPTCLTAGTNRQFFMTQGAGANPTWAAPAPTDVLVAANNVLLGNKLGASHLAQELTITGALDLAGSTNGQILARSAGTWAGTATPTLGASGTLGSLSMGNATTGTVTVQPVTGALGSSVMSVPALTKTLTATIASGAKALATGAIASAACTAAQTDTATGTLTTDVVTASFNGDPTGVTGYVPLTAGMLTIIIYPTADTFNAKVCNNTAASITPGAITLNWRVSR